MTAAINGTDDFVTRAEFLELKSEVDELGPLIRNSMQDLKSYTAKQQVFLANQELRDKELRRQVKGLQREDAEIRDSVKDLSAEAAKAEMIRIAAEKDREIARRDSLIKSLREDKKETRGWVVWAVRAALVAGGAILGDVIKHLLFP